MAESVSSVQGTTPTSGTEGEKKGLISTISGLAKWIFSFFTFQAIGNGFNSLKGKKINMGWISGLTNRIQNILSKIWVDRQSTTEEKKLNLLTMGGGNPSEGGEPSKK